MLPASILSCASVVSANDNEGKPRQMASHRGIYRLLDVPELAPHDCRARIIINEGSHDLQAIDIVNTDDMGPCALEDTVTW